MQSNKSAIAGSIIAVASNGLPNAYAVDAVIIETAARHGLRVRDIGSLRECGHISGVRDQDEQRMLRFEKMVHV